MSSTELNRRTKAILKRPISDSTLNADLCQRLDRVGIFCAGRLMTVTARQLNALHRRGILQWSDLEEIDEAIVSLSCEIAHVAEVSCG